VSVGNNRGGVAIVLLYTGVEITLLVSVVKVVLAAASPASLAPWEYMDILNAAVGILLAALVWFTIRLIQKYDRNQDIIFTKLEKLSEDFYALRGEHVATMRKGGCTDAGK
jgi:hypothetical protein